MHKWYEEKGNNSDVVFSTRVRLERNYKKYPFSAKIAEDEAKNLVEEIQAFCKESDVLPKNLTYTSVNEMSESNKIALAERQIISMPMIKKEQACGFLMNEEENVELMINGDDHVRIQTIYSGMNIIDCYNKANAIDDSLSDKFEVAFHEKYGYLTSSPTNLGTGLRVTYLLYLPALGGAGKMNTLAAEVSKYGVSLNPLFGDDLTNKSGFFQVSNQRTLGCTEQETIENLNTLVSQIAKQERVRREYILTRNYNGVEDQVYRAYGVLKYTKQIDSNDAVALISQLLFGINTGILKLKKGTNLFKMIMDVQSNVLQANIGKLVGPKTRDRFRADYINKNLPDIAG